MLLLKNEIVVYLIKANHYNKNRRWLVFMDYLKWIIEYVDGDSMSFHLRVICFEIVSNIYRASCY